MAAITQSITYNSVSWNVTFDSREQTYRGATAAASVLAEDLTRMDSVVDPNCEVARRCAIAKSLSGTLPTGVS